MSSNVFRPANWLAVGFATLTVAVLPWVDCAGAREKQARAKGEEKGKTKPAGFPLEARLVAKKATYNLDLGGKTREQFRKLLKGGPYPSPPAVDLVLELGNSGKKAIKFCSLKGDIATVVFHLKGPGAVNDVVIARNPLKARFYPIKDLITLAPGKKHTVRLTSLRQPVNDPGAPVTASYWTKPGAYTLTVTFRSAVTPKPKGAKGTGYADGFGLVSATTAPVKLQVVQGKKAQ